MALIHILGWILLKKLVYLRTSGAKPEEKEEA